MFAQTSVVGDGALDVPRSATNIPTSRHPVGAIHESPVIRDQRSVYIVGDGALDVPKTMKFAYAYGESPAICDQRSVRANFDLSVGLIC